MTFTPEINACRFWLQGKLYPNTSRDDFLSLLMGNYKLTARAAATALADAEWAEQRHDERVAAQVASFARSAISN